MLQFLENQTKWSSWKMDNLNLPRFDIQVKETEKGTVIFDIIRKKYIVLTPEEWVRQHLVNYLINHKGYPKSLIKVESGLKYNRLQKRSDVLVFDRMGKPFLLVECKSSKVKINQEAIYQGAAYNKTIGAQFLLVTNGLNVMCANLDDSQFKWSETVPEFPAS